jgi:hypothetical protein
MILHAASIAAFFVDQATQPQCLVKCVSDAGHDPIWARLFFEAVPSIFALGIAALVFYWNGGREHRRWILDQKKAEWSQLLRSVAEVQRVLRVVSTTEKERAELIAESLKPAIHELVIAQANCIFLQTLSADTKQRKKFFLFLAEVDSISEKISVLLSSIRVPLEGSTTTEKIAQLTMIQELTNEISDKYFEFQHWLSQEAAEDLGIASSKKSAGQK